MSNEPKGCLSFLFGYGGNRQPTAPTRTYVEPDPSAEEEGNYHSGPGGYEGMGYSGGYAADYRAEHDGQSSHGGEDY